MPAYRETTGTLYRQLQTSHVFHITGRNKDHDQNYAKSTLKKTHQIETNRHPLWRYNTISAHTVITL